ncbi:hypothetical protein EC80566_3779 [Escherichia coli 8.0566]|nr:hypothetical protein OQE_02370 [Escherichia coli J53]EKK40282.1 hypothetical protein EC80566_3779 [Escherichia coli 8.0566]
MRSRVIAILLDQMEQQNGAKNKNEHQDNGCHHCHLLDC